MGFILTLLSTIVFAKTPLKKIEWQWEEGREPHRLVVKFTEESNIYWSGQGLNQIPKEWQTLLAEETIQPRFSRDSAALFQRQSKYDPNLTLSDLRTYIVVEREKSPLVSFDDVARILEDDPRIEHLYLAYAPQSPPNDIPPVTPDFTDEQGYLFDAPDGFDSDYAHNWSINTAEIRVADIEYSWDPTHEDLLSGPQEVFWGWNSGDYSFHGNGVLGELIAADNGYGVTGMVPNVEVVMVSPYSAPNDYTVADAIENATSFLGAGDVLLIEQQAYSHNNYCPVEVSPAVFDAIQHAVAQGIVVVEPGGNGGQNLDDEQWDDWFNREIQDSGAILVGGGAAPGGITQARSWTGSSSYGSRIDLQGWTESIVSVGGEGWADLFFPENDKRQAYTAYFGGTSGASPMIVSAVVFANALRLEREGLVWEPIELREMLKYSAIPQPSDDPYWIGPQPDIRRFLWDWGLR